MGGLSGITFRNDFVESFPGDDSGRLDPRQTPGMLYSLAMPTHVREPRLLAWSGELARELGLERPIDGLDIAILGGNHVTSSMRPYAACYAGHQFGNWAGQLGDGRAITLGEIPDRNGRPWELQLKGAGPTAYSRRADGRAVLRSSVREYLMSEAMHHLGVPTTRALSLVTTGEKVLRDMFYNGNAAYEPGAVVARMAPCFLRFGNYEMPAARREEQNLKQLVEWTIARYFPHISGEDRVLQWFREVVDRTAHLMVEWMRVGFVHGVMNTDNMSILGLTIDYGPYSFVDDFDPDFTPNTTDLPGRRYAFGRQPQIAQWNLGCLAGAISGLLPETTPLIEILEEYEDLFKAKYAAMVGRKLGLDEVREEDAALIRRLELLLRTLKPDMTLLYQALIDLPTADATDAALLEHFRDSFYVAADASGARSLVEFLRSYQERIAGNKIARERSLEIMRQSSPRVILRNYLLHEAIEELENGSESRFRQLEAAMKEPYSTRHDHLVGKRPAWATSKAGCSMLSCSS
jgi:serine/tyrosine/threonine adenylyltransferase